MPILKACHFYVNKSKKSMFINEIMPVRDIEVSKILFNSFEDTTTDEIRINDKEKHAPLKDILESTGAPT